MQSTEQSPAFTALLELAHRSRRSAKGLPARENTKQEWNGIGFSLLEQKFVIPMGQVSELLEVPTYTHLPGVKQWVKGVANVRGRLLPIIDLAALLGYKLIAPQKMHRILIIESHDLYCGLLVDQSFGIQHFLMERYDPNIQLDDPKVAPYLLGHYPEESGTWHVFSIVNLIERSEFMSAARHSTAAH